MEGRSLLFVRSFACVTVATTGFNNNNYIKTLETIYKKRGVLSDDGDKWVDKHSGYYISNIDLDSGCRTSNIDRHLSNRDTDIFRTRQMPI